MTEPNAQGAKEKQSRLAKFRPLGWCVLSLLILTLDFLSGPSIQFPILYIFPIGLATWFSGQGWGIVLAVLLPLSRLSFHSYWQLDTPFPDVAINTAIRIGAFSVLVFLINEIVRERKQIRVLQGLLPICSACKKIRGEDGTWQQIERYIADRTDADFTHGVCPECMEKLYGELLHPRGHGAT